MSDIATEMAALDRMTTGDLAERYAELHGQPCRTRHRAYLSAWSFFSSLTGRPTSSSAEPLVTRNSFTSLIRQLLFARALGIPSDAPTNAIAVNLYIIRSLPMVARIIPG